MNTFTTKWSYLGYSSNFFLEAVVPRHSVSGHVRGHSNALHPCGIGCVPTANENPCDHCLPVEYEETGVTVVWCPRELALGRVVSRVVVGPVS